MVKLTRKNLALADRQVFECADSRSHAEAIYEAHGLDIHDARVLTDLRLTYTPHLFQKMAASEFNKQAETPPPLKAKRLDAQVREHSWAWHSKQWEAEATRKFGPPEVRLRKNRRYTMRLIRRHSERAIRAILKALSKLDDPMCCTNLRNHDLDAEPLEEIIQPFDLLGLHFSISSFSARRFTVDIGEAHGTIGSGGQFVLEQLDDFSFRIVDTPGQWIA